jgi:hypothetical protein
VNAEYRYISAFVVLFWLELFCALEFTKTDEIRKSVKYLILVVSVILIITSIISSDILNNRTAKGLHSLNYEVSKGLNKSGLQEDDKVAIIGLYDDYYWARLAKLRIIAEIPAEEIDNFWASPKTTKLQIFEAFKKAGAKVVIAGKIPSTIYATELNWKEIKNTSYYYYIL